MQWTKCITDPLWATRVEGESPAMRTTKHTVYDSAFDKIGGPLTATEAKMERYVRLLGIAVVCCGVLAGCGNDSRSLPLPTAASPTPQPTPQPPAPSGFTVSDVVSEVIGGQTMALEGAHVEDSERHVSVKTGADGSYTIRDVAISAFGGAYIYFAKEGYGSQVRQFPLTGEHRVDVTLVRQ